MKAQANSFTRRRFLETAIVGSIPVVVSGVRSPSTLTVAQGSCSSRLLQGNEKRLSNAVIDHVGSGLGKAYNAMRSRGSATADEVRAVAADTRLLFAHFDETQFTQVLDQQLAGCSQEVLDFEPQEDQLQQMSQHLTRWGVSIPPEQLKEKLSLSPEKRVSAISELRNQGVQGFEKQLAKTLEGVAKKLEKHSSSAYEAFLDEDDGGGFCDDIEKAIAAFVLIAAIAEMIAKVAAALGAEEIAVIAEGVALVAAVDAAILGFVDALVCR